MQKAKHCDCHNAKTAEWSIKNALTDKDFFDKYDAGDISFQSFETGKSVYGFCKYIPLNERCRDAQAQREAGGLDRRPRDQGGHLLSVAMGGCSDTENLVPMDGKLNQGQYKSLELDLISKLKKAGDDVYVEISSFNNDTKSQRPDLLTYNWVSRNSEGILDYGFETFLNEPEGLETDEATVEAIAAEFDEVMERAQEIDPIGPEWLEAKEIAPELLEDLTEEELEIDKAAVEAIAAAFDDME